MTELSPSIHRGARQLRVATIVAIVVVETAILLATGEALFGGQVDLPALHVQDQGLPPVLLATNLLLIGLFIGIALFRLVQMLGKVEAGDLFAAGDLRGFAFYLFVSVLVSIVVPMVGPLLAAGPGPHRLVASLSLTEGLMLLISGLLFFVARLLDAAQAIADDASQIV